MKLTITLDQDDIEAAISTHVRARMNTHSVTHVILKMIPGDDGCPPIRPSIGAEVTLEEMESSR